MQLNLSCNVCTIALTWFSVSSHKGYAHIHTLVVSWMAPDSVQQTHSTSQNRSRWRWWRVGLNGKTLRDGERCGWGWYGAYSWKEFCIAAHTHCTYSVKVNTRDRESTHNQRHSHHRVNVVPVFSQSQVTLFPHTNFRLSNIDIYFFVSSFSIPTTSSQGTLCIILISEIRF